MLILMKLTDCDVWQRLVLKYYIPTKNYRQNTIEMYFVNLKHVEKCLKFTDLLEFLTDLSSLVLK